MLRNVNQLRGYAIHATDGIIGEVDDLYFDDEDWAIRYLVVDTGRWLPGRKVLISPLAICHPDWMAQQLAVSLTKARGRGQSRYRHQEAGVTTARSSVLPATSGIRTTGEAQACGAWERTQAT